MSKLTYRVQVMFEDADMIRIRDYMAREGIKTESAAVRALALKNLPKGTARTEEYHE
jgi:hypothetical protein